METPTVDASSSKFGKLCSSYGSGFKNVGLFYVLGIGAVIACGIFAMVERMWIIAVAGVIAGAALALNGRQNAKKSFNVYEQGLAYDDGATHWECAYRDITAMQYRGRTLNGVIVEASLIFEAGGKRYETGMFEYPKVHDVVVKQMKEAAQQKAR